MQLLSYPDYLRNIALRAFGKYVSDLLDLLSSIGSEVHEKHFVQDVCRRLQEMITTVPPSLANEITARLLKCVEQSYREAIWEDCSNTFEKLAPHFLSAIFHPSVTRLEYFEENSHPEITDVYKLRIPDIIHHILDKINSVKILKLGSTLLSTTKLLDVIFALDGLEEFFVSVV